MKETAKVLKFKRRELKAASDITAVLEALMHDLIAGNIAPAEAKKIQKDVNERIKNFGAILKTLDQWQRLKNREN